MSIHSVLFDLDNTLYDYDAAHASAWRALTAYAEAELGLSEADFTALHEKASRIVRARTGCEVVIHNRLIRYQVMLEKYGRPLKHAPRMAELYWRTLLSHMQPMPGVYEVFDALRGMGLTLGVGTNMNADMQFLKLDRLGLIDRIDFIVTSEEVGTEKPDRRLFECCVEKAGCAKGECLFVGDNLHTDVLGALNAGLKAAWLCIEGPKAAPPEGCFVIASLKELPEKILSCRKGVDPT